MISRVGRFIVVFATVSFMVWLFFILLYLEAQ